MINSIPDQSATLDVKGTTGEYNLRRMSMGRLKFLAFIHNRVAVVSATIVLMVIFMAIAAPIVAPYDPQAQDLTNRLTPPSSTNLLGKDKYGRDILSRIIWGSRVSIQIGVIAVAIGAVLGALFGLIAGYAGGWLDDLIMRLLDIMLSLPTIVLALALMAVLSPSLTNVMIAVGVTMLPSFARLIRGTVLSEKEKDYVLAARGIGASHARILFRHILPNSISSIIILGTLRIASAILIESSLSFLGLGTEFDRPTWGSMINEGRGFIQDAPWVSVFPGFAIMFTVLGFSLLGDSAREILDPKLRQ